MSNTSTPKIRSKWSSQLSFILACSGAAVGLGNIWKFPYMAGNNGGGAFVIIYLVCVAAIGLPILLSEVLIGRRGHQNTVNSLRLLATETNASPKWQMIGWLCSITLLLILSFYSVVSGWSLGYLIHTLHGDFNHLSPAKIQHMWSQFTANPLPMLLWHTIFMLMTLWVVTKGIKKGIERASKILMPLLFAILIILVGYATSTGSFFKAIQFLFDMDFYKITPHIIISAMGHAFFTLAIGGGSMLIYGSYLSKNVPLGQAALYIVFLDVLVAILAGLAIFPIVFAYQLEPASGPGLMFKVLPIAFAKMGGGQFFGSLFFLLLLFAAWTSSIAIAEPLMAILTERYKISRLKAALLLGSLAWGLGVACLLSLNEWKSFKLLGEWTIFSAITDLTTDILLPLGGLLFAVFTGWVLHRRITREELNFKNEKTYAFWRFLIRWIAPSSVFIIMLYSLYSLIWSL